MPLITAAAENTIARMEIVRTPDQRFAKLPDFPWSPHWVEIPAGDGSQLRMAYIDEGPRDAPAVLMLHGEPTWSFLYRKVIAAVVDAGLRAIAPDLIGFGRSDKPVDRAAYTYQSHLDWLRGFLDAIAPGPVTLLCQDWGGLLGLRLLGEQPERFARVVATNTFLPTGDQPTPPAFTAWRDFSQKVPELPVGRIVSGGCVRPVAPEVMAAYDAPFPDERHKAGARVFPMLVPITPDDPASEPNRRAWRGLTGFARPFVTAFSDGDPITRAGEAPLRAAVAGAAGRDHVVIARAGHFVQEDAGPELAQVVIDLIRATPDAAP